MLIVQQNTLIALQVTSLVWTDVETFPKIGDLNKGRTIPFPLLFGEESVSIALGFYAAVQRV
jgi:hypothetical protein